MTESEPARIGSPEVPAGNETDTRCQGKEARSAVPSAVEWGLLKSSENPAPGFGRVDVSHFPRKVCRKYLPGFDARVARP